MSFTKPRSRHAYVRRSDQLQGYPHKQTQLTGRTIFKQMLDFILLYKLLLQVHLHMHLALSAQANFSKFKFNASLVITRLRP